MTRAAAGAHMRREIFEQPAVLGAVVARETKRLEKLGRALRERGVSVAVLAARGSSDHAAVLGKYLIEWAAGIPTALAAPSIATLYRAPLRLEQALVVGISQSGRSPDVVEYVRMARRAGALTLAITNEAKSPLAAAADETALCHAGPERSVAATKTFGAQLACLALVAAGWAEGRRASEIRAGLRAAPARLRRALAQEACAKELAHRLAAVERCVVLARGFSFPAALEIALKLKESAGLPAEGSSAADFLHGPVAASGPGLGALLLAAKGAGLETVRRAAERLSSAGASCLAIAAGAKLSGVESACETGAGWPEPLAALPLAALGQLVAYHLSLLRGRDPDRPSGLTKVTHTW